MAGVQHDLRVVLLPRVVCEFEELHELGDLLLVENVDAKFLVVACRLYGALACDDALVLEVPEEGQAQVGLVPDAGEVVLVVLERRIKQLIDARAAAEVEAVHHVLGDVYELLREPLQHSQGAQGNDGVAAGHHAAYPDAADDHVSYLASAVPHFVRDHEYGARKPAVFDEIGLPRGAAAVVLPARMHVRFVELRHDGRVHVSPEGPLVRLRVLVHGVDTHSRVLEPFLAVVVELDEWVLHIQILLIHQLRPRRPGVPVLPDAQHVVVHLDHGRRVVDSEQRDTRKPRQPAPAVAVAQLLLRVEVPLQDHFPPDRIARLAVDLVALVHNVVGAYHFGDGRFRGVVHAIVGIDGRHQRVQVAQRLLFRMVCLVPVVCKLPCQVVQLFRVVQQRCVRGPQEDTRLHVHVDCVMRVLEVAKPGVGRRFVAHALQPTQILGHAVLVVVEQADLSHRVQLANGAPNSLLVLALLLCVTASVCSPRPVVIEHLTRRAPVTRGGGAHRKSVVVDEIPELAGAFFVVDIHLIVAVFKVILFSRPSAPPTPGCPAMSRWRDGPHGRACALTRHPLLRHGCGQHACPTVLSRDWGICTKKCRDVSLHGKGAKARVKSSKIRKRVKLEPSGIFSLHLPPAYMRQNFDENFGSSTAGLHLKFTKIISQFSFYYTPATSKFSFFTCYSKIVKKCKLCN